MKQKSKMTHSSHRPPPDPDIRLCVVFRTTNAAIAAVAKSLLDGAGIEYEVRRDTLRGTLGAWDVPGFVVNVGVNPAEFLVRESDAESARQLLADLGEGADP